MTDILERLKGSRTPQGGLWPYPNLHDEAAAEIERLKAIASKAIREQIPMREEIDALKAQLEPFRAFASAEVIHALRAENARLLEVLKPFAEYAYVFDQFRDGCPDNVKFCSGLTYGDLRAARAAMGESDG